MIAAGRSSGWKLRLRLRCDLFGVDVVGGGATCEVTSEVARFEADDWWFYLRVWYVIKKKIQRAEQYLYPYLS
jgi:hypothetical protein